MAAHHPYGIVHIAWLVGIVATCILFCTLTRRNLIPQFYVRLGLALLIASGEVMRLFTDTIRWPDTLPLNLCNVTSWVAVYALLTMSSNAAEFAYYAGYGGAGMALITPDMGSTWPLRFFINHGAIILAGSVFVYGGLAPLRLGSIKRAYRWLFVYTTLTFFFDLATGANYSYLRYKPNSSTLLNVLGPWPWYILGSGAVALVLFILFWFPARPRSLSNAPNQTKPERIPMAAGEHS